MADAKMVGHSFSVDLNKPLAFQVGHLREAYDEWVHQPIVSKQSPRFFENEFIESITMMRNDKARVQPPKFVKNWFTRTQWWVVPLFWLPIVWWFVSSPTKNSVPRNHLAATVVVGVAFFTLIEYCLHRFLLHIKTSSYWGNTVHYIFHGCHHKHPMDHLRLVLPPPAAALYVVMFWNITKLFIPAPYSSALLGGEVLGYVIYDCTHYYLHHGKPLSPGLSLQLKRYHMNHHFRDPEKGFGVTTAFWDWVFGTLPSNSHKQEFGHGRPCEVLPRSLSGWMPKFLGVWGSSAEPRFFV